MTFQASLTANKPLRHSNPWVCSFRQALRETLLPVILNTLLFVVVITLTNLFSLITRDGSGDATYRTYKYCLFSGSMIHITFPILAWATALLQGLLTFRFHFSRNAAHTWFGLGLSRRNLFWSRYAAGAVGALLPLVVAMLTTLAVNLALFADVGLVLARFSFFLLGMGLQVLALYSIVVLVCCAAKTAVEGIAFSVILTLFPSMLLLAINGLMMHLLPGNGYVNWDSFYYSWNTELVRSLSDWNPLLFMYPYLQYFGGQGSQFDVPYLASIGQMPLMNIQWLLIPGWLAVTGALAWAARQVFLRTKVENTGVLGAGRVANYAGILALSFFAFSLAFMLPYNTLQKLSTGAMLGIGMAAAVAVMLAMAFPLRQLRQRFWKGLLPLGAGLAAMMAVCGILASGGFGYSGFLPRADAVKSITMSYNGLDFYMSKSNGGGSSGIVPILTYENEVTFTEQADIAAAMDIHRALIQSGIPAGPIHDATGKRNIYDIFTRVTYVMQDGSKIDRCYLRLTPELMKKMMALDNTTAVKQAYRDYLLQDIDMQRYRDGGVYRSGTVYLCGPSMATNRQLNLNEEQRKELLGCIADDLTAQTPEDRYLPQQPEKYILAFLPQGNTLADRENAFDAGYVYVTDQFARTLAFLAENDWPTGIDSPAAVESMVVMDYSRMEHSYDYNALYSFPMFFNGTGQQNIDSYRQSKEPRALPLDDKVRQQEILSRCHGLYWPGDGGYVVLIKYEGQDLIISAFLPAKDAPDYVIQGTK